MYETQIDLFESSRDSENIPLPHKLRPQHSNDFVGYSGLLKRYPFLENIRKNIKLPSFIIHGPPGSGKTTLANLIVKGSDYLFHSFSAVLGSVVELKKIMENARKLALMGKKSIIFVDEIHRFNKAQQDALLKGVEEGDFTLIGATTENPKYTLNGAILSRVSLVELSKISDNELLTILQKISTKEYPDLMLNPDSKELFLAIIHASDGDARRAINFLELILNRYQVAINKIDSIDLDEIKKNILLNSREYDRDHNRHYDVISAFIKSMRGSNPDAAILWLAVMLDGGEDPLFIARRLIIFASEDIGNADPTALILATSTLEAVKNIGMPEGRINLAQAVTYLSSTVKSNASYLAINKAIKFVENNSTLEVPSHLRSLSKRYKYPHDYPNHFVQQNYFDEEIVSTDDRRESKLPSFYQPKDVGREKIFKERLLALWRNR
jgi:putative ATPase